MSEEQIKRFEQAMKEWFDVYAPLYANATFAEHWTANNEFLVMRGVLK